MTSTRTALITVLGGLTLSLAACGEPDDEPNRNPLPATDVRAEAPATEPEPELAQVDIFNQALTERGGFDDGSLATPEEAAMASEVMCQALRDTIQVDEANPDSPSPFSGDPVAVVVTFFNLETIENTDFEPGVEPDMPTYREIEITVAAGVAAGCPELQGYVDAYEADYLSDQADIASQTDEGLSEDEMAAIDAEVEANSDW